MAIDNRKMARAIAALYRYTSSDEWTDTDEAIQQAAFGLWASCTCSSEEMAVYLMQESGLNVDEIAGFCDITVERVYAALRQAQHEQAHKAVQAVQP